MSDTVIQVEGLGKRYLIRHLRKGEQQFGYVALRDVLAEKARRLFRPRPSTLDPRPSTEAFWALQDVSFEVKQGERLGIIGRNGAGKSTLLKILSRITEPTRGRVRIKGRVASLLEVGTGFHPELTGRENIFLNGAILGMNRWEIRKKFDEIVAFAEVEKFLDTPVKHYSSGMYVRLAFAVAAHLEPDILVVDEVLAVGDAAFQRKCLGKMQDVADKEGRTVLFVSHNMGAVGNLCQKGIVLSKGCIEFIGDVEHAIIEYNLKALPHKGAASDLNASTIYQAPSAADNVDFAITRIEIFDSNSKPKSVIYSGEGFALRIHYHATRQIPRGSVALQFSCLDGTKALYFASDPDSGFPTRIESGEHQIECVFESFPLAGGDYVLGAGLAIPNVEYLCWTPDLCILTVTPGDVYGSGMLVTKERSLLIAKHQWRTLADCQIMTQR